MDKLRAGKPKHQQRPEQGPKAGNQHQEAQREKITHHWTRSCLNSPLK
jgi:hypothetical protein